MSSERKCQHVDCYELAQAEVYLNGNFYIFCKAHAYDITFALRHANIPYQAQAGLHNTVTPDLDVRRKGIK